MISKIENLKNFTLSEQKGIANKNTYSTSNTKKPKNKTQKNHILTAQKM